LMMSGFTRRFGPAKFSAAFIFFRWHTKLTLGAVSCSLQDQSILTGSKLHLREMHALVVSPIPSRPNHVRFGSKADMCSAQADVRFTPQ
jgi:hypothetical protein